MMRSSSIAAMLLAIILQVPSSAVAGGKTNPTLQTFTGEITESLCPKNHNDMMKEMKNMRMDKLTCEKTCIQMGAKYALYDAAKDEVYRLDDPKKIEPFAGRKVRIVGSLNKHTITVQTVDAVD